MALKRITADAALARLTAFDAIIDARSESEFAEDHLPGAVNWPVLDDAERHAVGYEYKQVSPFAARRRGAVLVARNIATHIERHLLDRPRDWHALVYCWRGGQRSGSFATVLDAIGFAVDVLEGGYREFRRAVLRELEGLPARFQWRVLCGRTGTGKSRLLQALAAAGAQVLDLEALACHRGSVLGPLPGQPQPTQKAFETALWHALRGFDPGRPVWSESESRTIGRLRVPEPLLERLRAASCVQLEMPLAARVELLMQDYRHFLEDRAALAERLAALRELRGAAVVGRWQQMAHDGHFAELVHELLELHYDPIYLRSMARNYAGFAAAEAFALADGAPATLTRAAERLRAGAMAPAALADSGLEPHAEAAAGDPADNPAGDGAPAAAPARAA